MPRLLRSAQRNAQVGEAGLLERPNPPEALLDPAGPPRRGTSKYRGVSLITQTGQWKSSIMCCGTVFSLGVFKCEEEAARVYDAATYYLQQRL